MVEEGVQRVPLTSDGSETETEPCDKALPMELDHAPASVGLSQGRFPAGTPITPPVVGVSHQQFCESVKGRKLPGDDSGRRSFDTFPTFVVGDPDARFDTHTPLTYETTGAKVPAHVGWTRCSPLCSQAGKKRSSVFSCLGPTSCKRLCHHATATGQ